MTEKFEVVGRAAVTLHGVILLMKTDEGEWTLPGTPVGHEQELDEAVKDEVEGLSGLEINVHQIVDAVNLSNDEDEVFEVIVHAEASQEELKDVDGIEFKWVDPANLEDYLEDSELKKLRTDRADNFVQKLKKIPGKSF